MATPHSTKNRSCKRADQSMVLPLTHNPDSSKDRIPPKVAWFRNESVNVTWIFRNVKGLFLMGCKYITTKPLGVICFFWTRRNITKKPLVWIWVWICGCRIIQVIMQRFMQARSSRSDERNQIIQSDNPKLKELIDENASLRKEKDDALRRLSELLSVRLRDNNPNIVDLNDPFRPTKLAEMFSELYDNEWTAAYSELEERNFSEVQIIVLLLDIIMEAYTFCDRTAAEPWKVITSWFLGSNLPGSQQTSKWLKDSRKVVAQSKVDEVHKGFLKRLTVICGDESVDEFLQHNATMQDYSRKCVQLCLLMVTTDPPVILDCPFWTPSESLTDASKNEDADRQTHTGQMVSKHNGEINSQLQHEMNYNTETPSSINETNLVSKMRSDVSKQIIVHEDNISSSETDEDNVAIKRHEDKITKQNDAAKRHSFDKNIFKEYTVMGQYLDFIVWPALYLHKDGPLLGKGVAQGTKKMHRDPTDDTWTWRRLHSVDLNV